MRLNDYVMRGAAYATHYLRNGGFTVSHLNYRSVNDNSLDDSSLQNIPSLMANRTAVYNSTNLDLPLGAVDLENTQPNSSILGFVDVPINAQADFGWPKDSHGAAFYQGDKPHLSSSTGLNLINDGSYDTSMPQMWNWYTGIFNTNHEVKIGNA